MKRVATAIPTMSEPSLLPAYLASTNGHKLHEFQQLLGDRLCLRSAAELGPMSDVAETASCFEGNARLKADALQKRLTSDAAILADDSGLMVDALDGAPGVLSARYAGDSANSQQNNTKLLTALAGVPEAQRTAQFVCVLVWRYAGDEQVFEGSCKGHIAMQATGNEGFGYDPLFIPKGYDSSFAVLGEPVKQKLSHRAAAAFQLAEYLRRFRA